MLGPAVGGELHELGGFMLPFLIEGGGALIQALVVGGWMSKHEYQDIDNNNQEAETEKKVNWTNVMTAPPIFLRNNSGQVNNIYLTSTEMSSKIRWVEVEIEVFDQYL